MAVAQADYLCLYSWNQTKSNSWPVGQVRKIVFTDTDVSVSLWGGDDTYSLPYADVRKFTFENEPLPSGINVIQMQRTVMRYDASRESLFWTNVCGDGKLQFYNMNGTLVHSAILSEHQGRYSLDALSPGIYVAKLTDYTSTYLLKLQIR